MRRVGAAAATFLLLLILNGPAQAQGGSASWSAGTLYVPAALSTSGKACESAPDGACASLIKPRRHPVIVFLHGCRGPRKPLAFLDVGALVVAPNSFSTGLGCSTNRAKLSAVVAARHVDIAYAAKRIADAPWGDRERLVLAGYSNGGQTAATYPGDEFKARVLIAWTCTNQHDASQNGVKGTGPVLAVLATTYGLYKLLGISGDCGEAVKGRGPGSRSILIDSASHDVLDHAVTREAVTQFMSAAIR
jgi:dienelactone hydrolase